MAKYLVGKTRVRCGKAQLAVAANTIYNVPGDFKDDISAEISQDFNDLRSLGRVKLIVESNKIFPASQLGEIQKARSVRACDIPSNAKVFKQPRKSRKASVATGIDPLSEPLVKPPVDGE